MRVDIQPLDKRKFNPYPEQMNINPHQPLSTLINIYQPYQPHQPHQPHS